jgi:hypothetical protein
VFNDLSPIKRAFAGQRHRMALEHTARGKFGPATLCETGQRDRQILAGNYAAKRFRRRGGVPRCTGSGRMKRGKLRLPRPTAPNGAGTQPAWRLPTPSCELTTRYPLQKTPTRQTENCAAKCPPPAWGGAPLRGVGLAAWPSRWVTGGPDLLGRLRNRQTWRRAAPNCEFRARRPLRKTPRA